MKIRNIKTILTGVAFSALLFAGCNALDTKEDLYLTDDMLATRRYQMFDMGYKAYSNIPYGFSIIDGNLFAAVSDEAQYVSTFSATQRFNEGSWNSFYNPNDCYTKYYNGIYDVHYYLENSIDYKRVLGMNRDTMNSAGKDNYYEDIKDVKRLRAEAHVLKAYYYFELAKRYGGVPIIDKTYQNQEEANIPRASFDEVISKIVSEIDGVKEELVVDWGAAGMIAKSGRLTKGAALAIKSRALLYAASPQFNPANAQAKWATAAAAANEVIGMGVFSLHNSYRNLFITDATNTSKETIWAVRLGQTNELERKNYPIGTPGGGTGITPSHNLVVAYEHKGEVTANMYENLDPRFYATVVKNGDSWNQRTMEIYSGGADDPQKKNASPTGYYLKKFLNEKLNLTNDAKEIRSWIVFRYAEILLNYAEAMNEAYGPDNNNGYSMTAREAVNAVRARTDVAMPPVNVASGDKSGMRAAIKHERRIELAFEDHRYWDLRRWDDAKTILNNPVMGVNVINNGGSFTYTPFEVAKRVFVAPKMNLFPIPQSEIVKTKGVLKQNTGW
jgi:hypothetical protein